jgi:hypothetical protein
VSETAALHLLQMVYLVREVWRGFSARSDRVLLPGGDKGLMRSTADLVLTRCQAAARCCATLCRATCAGDVL